MIAELIIRHFVGDFILQNDWMQRKTTNLFVCLIHVLFYGLAFMDLLLTSKISALQFSLLLGTHFLQDWFSLHLKWMKLFKQTPVGRWPVGPLCVDQSFHLLTILFIFEKIS